MASKLGKFDLTVVFCEFVVTTQIFWQKLVVNRTTAANFFLPNFVALLSHVRGMRTKGTNGSFLTRTRSRSRI